MNWTTIALLMVVGVLVLYGLPYVLRKIVEMKDNRDFRNRDK